MPSITEWLKMFIFMVLTGFAAVVTLGILLVVVKVGSVVLERFGEWLELGG